MKFEHVALSAGHLWSSPFVRWQGRLADVSSLDLAVAVTRAALAARVRPLAWGMTAALAGTMAANLFYLTMQFYYFYAFAALVLALPLVFARTTEPA